MTPKQVVQRAQGESFFDKNGDRVELVIAPALLPDEMIACERESHITIPPEIRELFEYTRGFTLKSKWVSEQFLEDENGLTAALHGRGCVWHPVWTDAVPAGLAPAGIEIMADICGNPWVVEVRPPGEWGAVFYVSHDPPMIAYQANDLASFLLELFLLLNKNQASRLITDAKEIQRVPLAKAALARDSKDQILTDFATTLKDEDLVADLRGGIVAAGFPWDIFGKATRLKRHQNVPLFGITRAPRKGILGRLFGKS